MENNIQYTITEIQEREIWPLADVKNYLRVSHDKDDKLIAGLVKSAIISAEEFLGLSLFTKKVTCQVNEAPNYFKIKYIPILKITEVFLGKGETRENITTSFGHVNPTSYAKIFIASKYLGRKLEIAYEAGLGEKIPYTILQGILTHVGSMYDFSESATSISDEIKNMYMPYRALKV